MKILSLILLLICGSAFAGDSGTYFNPERDGEGLQLTRSGDTVQFFFYTYDDHQGCYGLDIPDGGLANHDNCHETRWFLSSGDTINDKDDQPVEGWLYTGLGLHYPKCLLNPDDPFLSVCGQAYIAGRYLLARSGTGGWRMVVIKYGELLDKEDSLFNQVFEFNTLLFEATD